MIRFVKFRTAPLLLVVILEAYDTPGDGSTPNALIFSSCDVYYDRDGLAILPAGFLLGRVLLEY